MVALCCSAKTFALPVTAFGTADGLEALTCEDMNLTGWPWCLPCGFGLSVVVEMVVARSLVAGKVARTFRFSVFMRIVAFSAFSGAETLLDTGPLGCLFVTVAAVCVSTSPGEIFEGTFAFTVELVAVRALGTVGVMTLL